MKVRNAALVSMVFALTGVARAEQTTEVAQLREQMNQMKAELAQVRQSQGENWLNERRAEEVKALVREVLTDADTRASLAGNGATAGYNNGFFIADEAGNYLLKIGGVIRPRYVFSHQNSAPASTNGDQGGFEMACTRFTFAGNIIDPTWTFNMIIKFNNASTAAVNDAWIAKKLSDQWTVTFGQFKAPFMIEDVFSETKQQFVDRSLVNGALSASYVQGIMVTYSPTEWLRVFGSFNDGARVSNNAWNTPDTEYALTGRVEFKPIGEWKQYSEFESWTDSKPLLVVGGAVHHENSDDYATGNPKRNTRWTVDALYGGGGWSIFGAVVGNNQEYTNSTEKNQLAFVVQGGYFIAPDIELIGRYEWGNSDTAGEDNLSLVTAGVNYFWKKHNLKWTTDIGYAFNAVSDTWDATTQGWRMDAAGNGGQVVVRTQVQLMF